MSEEKKTEELEKMLDNIKHGDFQRFKKENEDVIITDLRDGLNYIKDLIREKGLNQTKVFGEAGISYNYGNKILNKTKVTEKKDFYIRVCYAAGFTIEETQRVLKKCDMPVLYVKNPREAFIMIMFNERPGDLYKVNELLINEGLEPLAECSII